MKSISTALDLQDETPNLTLRVHVRADDVGNLIDIFATRTRDGWQLPLWLTYLEMSLNGNTEFYCPPRAWAKGNA